MKKHLAIATILVAACFEVTISAEETPEPAPVYVMMVSHFDRPWVFTEDDLKAFEDLTKNHPQMVWTHLFNPAAFTQPTPLREAMERFVKTSRDEHGAEIGVHLHMYKSLLTACGVPFRVHPSVNAREVAGSIDPSGYGVPMSSYSPAEIRAMLEFTLKTFEERGLGRPATFCAGYYTTSVALQKEVAAQGFSISAAALPPGTEVGRAYPPSWHELCGWDESVRIDTRPYRISQQTILPGGKPPYIEAKDGRPMVEIPQTCKIDWMVTSDDMKLIFKKHLAIAREGQPTAVCLAIHEMSAKENFAKYDEVLRLIDEHVARTHGAVPVHYATVSAVRNAFLEYWSALCKK